MTRILSVAPVLPPHTYRQDEITAALATVMDPSGDQRALLTRLHEATTVRTRHLAMPLERYGTFDGFTEANQVFADLGLDLAERGLRNALDLAGLNPTDVDVVVSTTVTGVVVPSLEARLVDRVGLRPDVKRLPLFGLGCVAGAAGIARIHDYLVGHPDEVAVLISVELCSLTVQRDDTSAANLVASGLFGDGAAAVVLVGEHRAARMGVTGPRVVDTVSRMYPDTERVMGWDIGGSGFRIVLAPTVADVVQANLGSDVTTFLARHDLAVGDVRRWVAHPGGPKVLDAMTKALGLPGDALDVTWRSLAAVGNLSSSSVLHVLADTMALSANQLPDPAAGTSPGPVPAVLLAMGPGFCAELVLLDWDPAMPAAA